MSHLRTLAPLGFGLGLGRRLLGWDVHPTAQIGRSFIHVRKLTLGPHTIIGDRNVIRHLEELTLAEGASIGSRNFISAIPRHFPAFSNNEKRYPSLILGKHAGITVAHELDCCDRIELEDFAVVSGFRCQLLTHNLDLVRDRLVTSPMVIGERSFVMSGCILLCGTGLPARSILSAGSVVTTKPTTDLMLYRGNPAEAIRPLPANLRLFKRTGRQEQLADALDEATRD